MGDKELTVALAGNPNVGKSTVFNALTGLKQHTGNWTGKTVDLAVGKVSRNGIIYNIVDIPGTYSLKPHSFEEEVAGDYICFGEAEKVCVVLDATKLERNLYFALQVIETGVPTVLCVNLMDEARKKKIVIDLPLLSRELGVNVTGASASENKGIDELIDAIADYNNEKPIKIKYSEEIERAAEYIVPVLVKANTEKVNKRWLALRLLEKEKTSSEYIKRVFPELKAEIEAALGNAYSFLADKGIGEGEVSEIISKELYEYAKRITDTVVVHKSEAPAVSRFDKLFTNGFSAYSVMLIMLFIIFFLTVKGANVPSAKLSELFFYLEGVLHRWGDVIKLPAFLDGILISGGFRVLGWVVSVMLPPMAIFFPCFTLLEDLGVLPRVAYVLDSGFKKADTCGKQALTTCMGYGCNCVGISGARIIDSKRERLIAMLTNTVTPCNGKFPAMITLLSIFITRGSGALTAAALAVIIVASLGLTLALSRLLSRTILKGESSHYILELPPFRRPQITKVIVSSVVNRTALVLIRAVAVAFPAGAVIWLLANTELFGASLLASINSVFEPLGKIMGLDGESLGAFFLGVPANEIVLPVALMSYTGAGELTPIESTAVIREILVSNGWSGVTAACYIIFSVVHFPCATSLITFFKETKSIKWTVAGFLIPLIAGVILCVITAFFMGLIFN